MLEIGDRFLELVDAVEQALVEQTQLIERREIDVAVAEEAAVAVSRGLDAIDQMADRLCQFIDWTDVVQTARGGELARDSFDAFGFGAVAASDMVADAAVGVAAVFLLAIAAIAGNLVECLSGHSPLDFGHHVVGHVALLVPAGWPASTGRIEPARQPDRKISAPQ